ncbi:MAG: Hypothetical protein BHV28_08050 [Candidatus Tokpelaia hoelldobleri]|uniref:Uncharacterized protein n=1 Tax=Candidatus Tokpelaia hoelldobleri TaxID=1902579 RepID=A0A1U9JUF8_9HYPH|nr:MAG: Hypothetical protein BHV28_08050 [Candidatus Tokpelaia hoelldoblerii]
MYEIIKTAIAYGLIILTLNLAVGAAVFSSSMFFP